MELVPFRSIGGLAFGLSQEQVRATFGEPQSGSSNSMQDLQLEYPDFVARFHEVGGLVEVSVNVPAITINNQIIPFQNLHSFLKKSDNGTFESLGFIISPNFGVSFDPCCPNWVTAFSLERKQIWLSFGAA